MTRILVFFPHNPFPPRSGAHRRCLQILQGFQLLGSEVLLASSTHTSDMEWSPVGDQTLRAYGISKLYIHSASIWDRRYIKYMHKFYHALHRTPPLDSANYAPPGLCHWFRQLTRATDPDLILINYAFWGRLLSSELHRQYSTAIDMHDFISLYRPRFLLMERFLSSPPFSPETVDPVFLQENFFDSFDFQISPAEFAIYNRFKYTIAITRSDADLIQHHATHTRVITVPMTQETALLDNQYDGAALYTPGRNPFNVQGYLYFAARVLPRVLEREPSFCLHVSGAVSDDLAAVRGVKLLGFVPDLIGEYTHSRFLICPILGKTGQQIKIVEAMAYGVPVVATAIAAEGSPIRHGENGFIADGLNEFTEYVVRLWQDHSLCQRMGTAARETIALEFSQEQLLGGLRQILNTAEQA